MQNNFNFLEVQYKLYYIKLLFIFLIKNFILDMELLNEIGLSSPLKILKIKN